MPERTSLDELDFAILSQLQEDGRKSFSEIGKELGVAANTIGYRVARLVEAGTLHFYGRVNPLHAGLDAYAEIHISVEPSKRLEAVVQEISEYPEVSFLVMTAGEYELIVEVMCRDNQHLTDLLNQRLRKIPGIQKTKTIVILDVIKFRQPDLKTLRAGVGGEGS